MKKTLQELTIKDPFMFAAIMSDEERCKEFLSIVLKKEILKVTVVTEKNHYLPSRISWCPIGCPCG